MRPRHQTGQITHKGSNWVLRFHEDRASVDGAVKRVRTTVALGPYAEHPYKGSAADIAKLRDIYHEKITTILAPVNRESPVAKQAFSLGDFILHSYFPRLEFRVAADPKNELHMEPSTVKGYQDIWNKHIKGNAISKLGLQAITPRDARSFIESLSQDLSHQSHMRIKAFLSGVFEWAIADNAFTALNPFSSVKAGGRKKGVSKTDGLSAGEILRRKKIEASNTHAYTLEEVAEMLDKLPEPARTVCAVAALTGLSRSELRGLKWEDYDGETISVRRKVWGNHVGPTKTEAREAGVYVVPQLRNILKSYRKKFPPKGEGWMFRGERLLNPLDLDNLSRREIPQHINGAWFGWHAFRRGLGTRLNEAGVNGKEIQSILRHANISTTMDHYVVPSPDRTKAALKKLAKIAKRR
jgi:integrase